MTSIELTEMTEAELIGLHERLLGAIAFTGLSGHALDEALASAMFGCLPIIESERAVQRQRRETLKAVE